MHLFTKNAQKNKCVTEGLPLLHFANSDVVETYEQNLRKHTPFSSEYGKSGWKWQPEDGSQHAPRPSVLEPSADRNKAKGIGGCGDFAPGEIHS